MKRLYPVQLLFLCAALFLASSTKAQKTCANATVISTLPYTANGLTTCGQVDDYRNFCSSGAYANGEDYVFTYTPTTTSCVNIDITGNTAAGGYGALFITKGCPGAAGTTCIASTVNTGTTGNPSVSNVTLTAGTQYYIIVDTWPSPSCTPFNINMYACPPGRTCADALVIPSLPFTETNTTCGKIDDYDPSGTCGGTWGMTGEDIVYTYTPTTNQCVNVAVTGPSWTGVTVMTKCPGTAGATCLGYNLGNAANPGLFNLTLTAGTTYYIIIDSNDPPNCVNFTVNMYVCPPGNTCVDPYVISSLPFTDNSTTCGSGNNYTATGSCSNRDAGGEDKIYTYTPTTSGCINLSVTGNYTGVYVFDRCPNVSGVVCLGTKGVGAPSGTATLSQVPVVAGKTYYIMVDTWPNPTCTGYNLKITDCPPGANCNYPKTIPSIPFNETSTTCDAGADFGLLVGTDYAVCGPAYNDDGEDFTYTFTAPRNMCLNLSITAPSHPEDLSLVVTQGCPTSASSKCLALSEGSGSAGPAQIQNLFVFAGTTIYITVDADDVYFGCTPFTLNIDTCNTVVAQCGGNPQAADNCSNATPACDFTGYCGSTSTAYSADTPSNLNNVFCGSIENNSWITFIASATTATFNIFYGNCDNAQGIQAMILEATNCANFVSKSNCYQPQSGQGVGVVSANNLIIGNTYYLMVDGYAGDHCDYVISAKSGILLPVDAGPDQSICPGKSVTLTASNGNGVYKWTPGPTGTGTFTGKSMTVSPVVTTNYYVQSLAGSIGCVSPDYDTVTVIVVPTVQGTTSQTNANTCTGACDGSATLAISNGQAPYTITWSNGSTTAAINGLCPDSTYRVSVYDNLGCADFDTVIMPPKIMADFTPTTPACNALTGSITVARSSGTGTFSYTGPGGLTITNAGGYLYNVTATAYGDYNVTWTVTDGTCTSVKTLTITFRQNPTPDFGFTPPACGSKVSTLTTTPTVGSGTFTFSGPGSITFTGSNPYTATATNFGTYAVKWKVDNQGCQDSITKNITFTAQPVATYTLTGPNCNALTFTANTTVTVGTGAWTYTGPSGAVMTFTAGSPSNVYNGSVSTYGTYTATWTVTNGTCSASTTQTLNFYKQPVASAGTDNDICGLSTNLGATPSDGTGAWTQISGPSATITPASSATATVTSSGYGTSVFRWTEINGTCPASTDDVSIVFSQNPAGNAGPDQDICGFNTNLAGVATIGTGVWSGSGVTTPTSATSGATTAAAGTRTFTWTITNGSCAALVDQVDVKFNKVPTPNAGADQSICGLSTTLDALPPTGSGTWINPANTTVTPPTNPKAATSSTVYGVYNYVWQEVNGPCPAVHDTVRITYVETPAPNAGPDQSVCGLTVTMNAANSAFNGTWTGAGNIITPSSRTTQITSSSYGSFNYVWTEFNASPCPSKTDTVRITFVQKPTANAGPDKNVCGKTTTMAAIKSIGASTGLWTASSSDITFTGTGATAINPTVNSINFGTYTLYWTETNTGTCPSSVDSAVVNLVPATNPNAGADDKTCGLTYTMQAIPSYGQGSWTYSGPGVLVFSSLSDPHANITATNYGVYRIAWTEDNKPCIANTDTTLITFFEPPVVEAGSSPDKVCGLNYQLNATATVGKGKWTWLPDAGVTGSITFQNGNDSIPNARVTSDAYGKFFFVWNVQNGTCMPPSDTVELTFWERPHPKAGNDTAVCDTLTVQLNGTTSVVGAWRWRSEFGGSISFLPDSLRANPTATASLPGIYKLYFDETNDPVCGVTTDSMTIRFDELPIAGAGIDDIACGSNYIMNATEPTIGSGKWTILNIAQAGYTASIADDTLFNTQVSISPAPPATGVDVTFIWTVANGSCSDVKDTILITFKNVPNQVDAGPDQTLCGTLTTTMNANDDGASGVWEVLSKPAGSTAGVVPVISETGTFTADKSGVYTLQRKASVFGCANLVTDVVQVDFRTLPIPNAGLDDSICGPNYTLTGITPGGRITGLWHQADGPGTASFTSPTSAQSAVNLSDNKYGLYTFVWLESNLSCPDVTDTVKILFNQQPLAEAGVGGNFCGKGHNMAAVRSIDSLTTEYTSFWTQTAGPGTATFFNGTGPTDSVSVDEFGTYTFKWTESNGSCITSIDSVQIYFVNPSNPNAGPDTLVCSLQDTLRAVPSFGSGKWIPYTLGNPGTASFSFDADPNAIVTVSAYGVYRFDWLEANSPCYANSDSVFIRFNEQPTANAGIDKDTCALIIQLNATPSVSGPDYTASWSGPSGAVFSPDASDPNATVDVTSVGFGTHIFTWTESNGNCTVSTDDVAMTFIQTPVAEAGTALPQTCGKSASLNAVPSVGNGEWTSNGPGTASFVNGSSSAATDVVVSSFGDYVFYWTETSYGNNGGFCTTTDSVSVSFFPQPNSYAGSDSIICGNEITVTAYQSVSASTMNWSNVGGTAGTFTPANAETTTINVGSNFGTHDFVFSETIGSGTCFSADTVRITFVQQPVANAGSGDSLCALSTTLIAYPTVGNGSWRSLTSGVVIKPNLSEDTITISAPGYGIYDLVWTEDNGSPCAISRDTVRVGFFATPKPKAGLDFSVCGTIATLNATVSVYPGTWTYAGSKVTFVDSSNAKTQAILHPLSSADYGLTSLRWTENNAGVCSAFDDVSVFFSEKPVANAGPDQSICGLNFNMAAVPSVGNGTWDFVQNDTLLANFGPLSQANATGTMKYYGSYDFLWIEKNPGICPADTDEVKLTFIQAPLAYAGRDTALCALTDTLQAVASVGTGTWSVISGPGAVQFGNVNSDTTDVEVSIQGTYLFKWEEDNSATCPISSDTVQIKFEKVPVPVAGPDQEICGLGTNLGASPSIGTGTWTYVGDPTANVSFGNINSPTSSFTTDKYGVAPIIWTEINTALCGPREDTLILNFVEQPLAYAGKDSALCGESITLGAVRSVGDGMWTQISGPAGTIVSPTDANSLFIIQPGNFGTYLLQWTETTASPCQPSSDTVQIDFYELPTANAGTPQDFCGLRGQLAALPSIGQGKWFLIPSGTQDATFDSISDPNTKVTVTEYGTYAFAWQEQNGTICSPDVDVVIMTFYEQPIANAGSDLAVCDMKAKMVALPSAGTGVWSQLNPGEQLNFADSSLAITDVFSSFYGEAGFTWTETNGKVCPPSTDTMFIDFVQQPIARTNGDDRVCGKDYVLTATKSVGSGKWTTNDPGAIFLPSDTMPNAKVTVPNYGNFNFVWTEVNRIPCATSSTNLDIEFIEPPTGSLTPTPQTSCSGDPVTLTFNLTGTGPFNVTYATNGVNPQPLTGISNGHTITVNPTSTTIYQIKSVVDGSGMNCSTTSSAPITVNVVQRPTGSISGNYTICFGDSLTIPVKFTGTAPFTASFDNGPSKTFPTANGTYTFKPGANTSLTMTSVSDASCSGSVTNNTITITSNALPAGTLSRVTTNNLCAGDSTLLQLNFSAGLAPYKVYIGGGAAPIIRNNVSSGDQFQVKPLTGNTTYRIDSIVDANGCKGAGTQLGVTVYQRPTATVTATAPICETTPSTFTFGFTPAGSGPWTVSYNDGTATTTTSPISNGGTMQLFPDSTTQYKFTNITDQATGCTNVLSIPTLTVVVVPQPTVGGSLLTPQICRNDSAMIRVQLSGIPPFSLTFNDGKTYNGIDNGDTIWVKPTSTYVYTVTNIVDGSGLSCPPSNGFNIKVDVNQLPPVSFEVSGTSTCAPLIPTFVNTTNPGFIGSSNGTYWRFGDGTISNEMNPTHEYTQSGSYAIHLRVTSNQGCTDTLSKIVTMTLFPDPRAVFSYAPENPTVLENEVHFINESIDAVSQLWNFAGMDSTGEESPDYTFPNTDSADYKVCLTVTSDSGCINQQCQVITVSGILSVFVPTAFTPNGDLLNDYFIPSIAGTEVSDYEFLVYNRWGNLVFSSNNPEIGWDGTHRTSGDKLGADVFTWRMEFKNKYSVVRYIYDGKVQLVR